SRPYDRIRHRRSSAFIGGFHLFLRWTWGASLNFRNAAVGRSTPGMTATVGTALQAAVGRLYAAGIDTARLDARLLLGDVLKLATADLVAHPERPLAAPESERFRDLIERRCRHQPVSQLLARREFWGLTLRVTADTLIPRPETETVVEAALAPIADRAQAIRILDLGTGTGCSASSNR
ncbi:MAG: N5-glutamine methyltransferase family protein, partial [Vicinamibacterales bacterium]